MLLPISPTLSATPWSPPPTNRWILCATSRISQPNVDYYTVRQNGAIIQDLQFTLSSNGNSPYMGQNVTVKGIVTASTKQHDLGFLYIQDAGGGPWSGIWCVGSGITQFFREEEVIVSGTVEEYYGMTRLNVASISKTGNRMMPVASVVNPSDSAEKYGYAWEQWEGCLVRLEDPAQQKLHIAQTNLGFGDYAVSNTPGAGYWNRALVLAGRQSATSFSSLYVQLVTNAAYDTLDGSMEVTPIVVSDTMNMDAVEGICFYGFSNYRVLPRNNDDFIGINVALDTTDLPQSTVGILHPDALQVRAYPNPGRETLVIEAEAGATFQLIDAMGRPVSEGRLTQNRGTIAVGHLGRGTYLLVVDKDGQRQVLRIALID
ncbi:MAG: T9SS C-terminal target domain-containing protein [Flavobacteriia bacterium]|nr:T9SS C-terminal target domain-containing protein [Flavobacteriia bacterium]